MKKIITIFCLLSINVFGQSQRMYPSLELFMRVIHQNDTQTEISLSSKSNTWDYNKYTDEFFITTDQDILNSSVIITGTDTSNNNGWDMVTSRTAGGVVCGIGVYKMQADVGNAYFHIDFRECQFALGSQAEIDTWFRYNRDEDNFYWNDLLREDVWHSISNGELIRIWNIKNTTPSTSCIDNFWENCLVFLVDEIPQIRIVWGAHPTYSNPTYCIYRSITNPNDPPPSENDYLWIKDFNGFEFIDNGIEAVEYSAKRVRYFIKANNGYNLSDASNVIQLYGIVNWSQVLYLTNDNNHPRLVWGPYPSGSATSYKIYRAVSSTPLVHPELYAQNIATVNQNTFYFVDNGIGLSGPNYIYYFVRAVVGGEVTERTNILDLRGIYYADKIRSEKLIKIERYDLYNSPNPFNPTTVISYQLASDSYITLKVFDLLGREITTLAEGIKPAGKYEVEFDAHGLPSGTYIYTLNTNGKVFSKKMQLIK